MNPRDAQTPYSLSRGAPSASWVLLQVKVSDKIELSVLNALTVYHFSNGV